jgi:hypothetical protein
MNMDNYNYIGLSSAVMLFLFFAAVVELPVFTMANTSQTVNAVITVLPEGCPFSLSLVSTYAVYLIPTDANLTYSINAIGSECSGRTSVSGNIIVRNSTTDLQVYSGNFSYSGIGTAMFTNTIAVNTVKISHGDFVATASFANSLGASNSSALSFQALYPANLILSNLAISPSSPTINSQVTLSGTVSNKGDIAAGNVVLNFLFSGSNTTLTEHQPLSSMPPGSSSSFQISFSNVSSVLGAWSADENVTYNSILDERGTVFGSNYIASKSQSISYLVVKQPSGSSSTPAQQLPPPPSAVGLLRFSEVPLFLGMLNGTSASAQIGLSNNASVPIWVNMSVPKISSVSLMLSSTDVYLPAKESQFVGASVETTNKTMLGTYVIPINFTAAAVGGSAVNGSFYINFNVQNRTSNNTVTQTISLLNYSKQASAALQVRNPTNRTIFNATVSVKLPVFTAANASDIIPSGQIATVSRIDNLYVINYTISKLGPKESTYLYYTVKDVKAPEYLDDASTSFISRSVQSNSTLRITDISVPTFYKGKSGYINVTALYVGGNAGNVSFRLGAPPGIVVSNQYQPYMAFSNQLLRASFQIGGISQTGTYLLTLYASAPGTNQSYSIPILVIQGIQGNATAVAPNGEILVGNGVVLANLYAQNPLLFALVPFIIILVAYGIYRARRLPRHRLRKEKAEGIARLKEQIERKR